MKPFTGLIEKQRELLEIAFEPGKNINGRSTPEEVEKYQTAWDAYAESMREYYENRGFSEKIKSIFSFDMASKYDPRNPPKRTPRGTIETLAAFFLCFSDVDLEAGKRAAVGFERCSAGDNILDELIAMAEQLMCFGPGPTPEQLKQ